MNAISWPATMISIRAPLSLPLRIKHGDGRTDGHVTTRRSAYYSFESVLLRHCKLQIIINVRFFGVMYTQQAPTTLRHDNTSYLFAFGSELSCFFKVIRFHFHVEWDTWSV